MPPMSKRLFSMNRLKNGSLKKPVTVLILTYQRYIAPGRTRLQGGRGTQSVHRKKAISPYWEQNIVKRMGGGGGEGKETCFNKVFSFLLPTKKLICSLNRFRDRLLC